MSALHSLQMTESSLSRSQRDVHFFNKFQTLSYAKCEHLWSYGGKLVLLTRNLLNAAARNSQMLFVGGTSFPCQIKNVVTHMKLLSIVGVPFSLVDLKNTTQKIFKSFSTNDKEGLALGALSFSLIAADTFDSTTTFVNSALAVTATSSTGILSSTALPIGFFITSAGTLSRIIHIAKASQLYRKIHPDCISAKDHKNKDLLAKTLEAHLGIAEEQKLIRLFSSCLESQSTLEEIEKLKEKKKAILLRLIPKDAMASLEKIFSLLESHKEKPLTDQELGEVFQSLETIRSHLEKKMSVDVIGILANLFMGFALVLFSIGITTALPFLLMATAFTIRLSSLIYQEQKLQLT